MELRELASEQYCYLTTVGRRSGEPREIETWFSLEGRTLYMLAGGRERAHWVRNALKTPDVTVRIDGQTFLGTARLVPDAREDERARQLLVAKYQPAYAGDLSDWGRSALPVAVDLDVNSV